MSGVTVFFLGWFHSAKSGQVIPPAKFLIGSSITFLVLEVVADIQPDVAAALALAVGTTAFFHYGPSTLSYVNGTASSQPAQAPAKSTPSTPVHVAPHR